MVEDFKNKKITIMGLGLNGGGLASAQYFLKQGADLTITDLRTQDVLQPTLDLLKGYNIKYTLGEHKDSDFTEADIVIKNPGVRSTSKYLKLAKRVESDISIFLSQVNCPIIAVTGSKGKSSTVSALDHVLKSVNPNSKLGGNITVSPLTFIDEVTDETPVVLELSSWQLADIKNRQYFKPVISAITNIMNDHQNAYNSLDEYADDKAVIFENNVNDVILNLDDSYTDYFKNKLGREPLYISGSALPTDLNGAYIDKDKKGYIQLQGSKITILEEELSIKGEHQRLNMLLAGLILYRFGIDTTVIKSKLADFKGIKHRMEHFITKNDVKFYNDSAATIPEAVTAAINSFSEPIILISGGTDKELEYDCIRDAIKKPKSIYLLEGSGSDKMIKVLKEEGVNFNGPYASLKELVNEVISKVTPGDNVVFSPGATSFGMFNNEFDRGNQFKEMISNI